MISRKTTLKLGEIYTACFMGFYRGNSQSFIKTSELYDFLFSHDYDAWFCNKAQKLHGLSDKRSLKEFILKIHTGETLSTATSEWTWKQREKLGQRYLKNLSEDLLQSLHDEELKPSYNLRKSVTDQITLMKRALELDGYVFRESKLLMPEKDFLDVEQEATVLQQLHKSLKLADEEITFHHLELSEEHYINGLWDDSISNARKFLENILNQIALAHSQQATGSPLSQKLLQKPFEVRNYLEKEGLLESKEKEALRAIYGLLSETGGHPYIAENEQARLLRHLALTFSQFAMLRYEGYLK